MAVNELDSSRIDRLLLRLVKRLKAHNSRVFADAAKDPDVEFYSLDYENVIYDFLGVPADTAKHHGDRAFCRDGIDWKLHKANTDSEILNALAECRKLAAECEANGWVLSDEWNAFDDFAWGEPAPFESEVIHAVSDGAELAHGMNRYQVLDAWETAKRRPK